MRHESELRVSTDYRVLHEDGSFLVVEKPAPLPVHAVGCYRTKNLLSLLRTDRPAEAEGLRIVNRLDAETSGIVLVARTAEAAAKLSALFERHEVEKIYHAVVFGTPEPRSGSIEVPLGVRTEFGHHVRVADPAGQTARTDYGTLATAGEYSLLKAVPRTGRTHQIRAHLAFLGHPIVGDKIYIDPSVYGRYMKEGWQEDMRPIVKTERLLLHASEMGFCHPATGRPVRYRSAPPSCFEPEGLPR